MEDFDIKNFPIKPTPDPTDHLFGVDQNGDIFQMPAPQALNDSSTNWQTATLNSGWQHKLTSVKFRKNTVGQLEITGAASASPANSGVLFTLPAEYRPDESKTSLAVSENGIISISIGTNGSISVGSNAIASITFPNFPLSLS